MARFDKKLGTILARCGVIDEAQRDELLAETERNNSSLTQIVIDRKLARRLAEHQPGSHGGVRGAVSLNGRRRETSEGFTQSFHHGFGTR